MKLVRLFHDRSSAAPRLRSFVMPPAMVDPNVVAKSDTNSISEKPNDSNPAGATDAASANMGMYPNINPPDATTLLMTSAGIGASMGVRDPSHASTTNNLASPQRESSAAATKNELFRVKPSVNPKEDQDFFKPNEKASGVEEIFLPELRAQTDKRAYPAVPTIPPAIDVSDKTPYPQFASVNCEYVNVLNVTSAVGGRR
mmetsp:Transcript_11811/g.43921  ORF Transcript_11811/g.43921 Transcript_11811/m.43921 type:complete len:200 (+) Transcript_11811:283-882(+)